MQVIKYNFLKKTLIELKDQLEYEIVDIFEPKINDDLIKENKDIIKSINKILNFIDENKDFYLM